MVMLILLIIFYTIKKKLNKEYKERKKENKEYKK